MTINNINQIFNQKIQDINSRITTDTNISNKFQSILDQTQLKNTSSSTTAQENSSEKNTTTTISDPNELLKTMLSTQSLLNSSSFSASNSSSLFPTSSLNNTINMIQQAQLLNALKNNTQTTENNGNENK